MICFFFRWKQHGFVKSLSKNEMLQKTIVKGDLGPRWVYDMQSLVEVANLQRELSTSDWGERCKNWGAVLRAHLGHSYFDVQKNDDSHDSMILCVFHLYSEDSPLKTNQTKSCPGRQSVDNGFICLTYMSNHANRFWQISGFTTPGFAASCRGDELAEILRITALMHAHRNIPALPVRRPVGATARAKKLKIEWAVSTIANGGSAMLIRPTDFTHLYLDTSFVPLSLSLFHTFMRQEIRNTSPAAIRHGVVWVSQLHLLPYRLFWLKRPR